MHIARILVNGKIIDFQEIASFDFGHEGQLCAGMRNVMLGTLSLGSREGVGF